MMMMSGTPARTPRPLKRLASIGDRQPPFHRMKGKRARHGTQGQVLEHSALDLIFGAPHQLRRPKMCSNESGS
jgi:hypothetical protein